MIWVSSNGGTAWLYKLGDDPTIGLEGRLNTIGRISSINGAVYVYPKTRSEAVGKITDETRITLGQIDPDLSVDDAKALIEQWWTPARLMKLRMLA